MNLTQVETFKDSFIFYHKLFGAIFVISFLAVLIPLEISPFYDDSNSFLDDPAVENSFISLDSVVLVVLIALVPFEISVVLAASSYTLLEKYGTSFYYLIKILLIGIYLIPEFLDELKNTRNTSKQKSDYKFLANVVMTQDKKIINLNNRIKKLEDMLSDKDK